MSKQLPTFAKQVIKALMRFQAIVKLVVAVIGLSFKSLVSGWRFCLVTNGKHGLSSPYIIRGILKKQGTLAGKKCSMVEKIVFEL